MKDEASKFLRWSALILASLTMFGNYYLYDSVAYVSVELEKQLNFSDQQFGLLYSAYSFAAIAILFFSGLFVDRFGTRLSILIFGILCTVSGFITAVSSSSLTLISSRLILGLGAEPLVVAVTVSVAKWFKGRVLGFALGINLLIARLGSLAVDRSPSWAKSFYDGSYSKPLLLAACIGLLCSLGAILYYFLELKAERSNILGKAGETDKFQWKDIFNYSKSFWYVVLLCVTFYSAIFPFRAFAPKFFEEAHGVTKAYAGKLNSLLPFMAMIATPLIGLLIDKIGKRALLMFAGSALLLPVFLLMGYTSVSLYIPVVFMGIAFSLIPAIMWPSVAYIVDERRLGTAYGLMTLIQQVGVLFFAWFIGWANDFSGASATNPKGYNLGMLLLSVLGLVGLIFSLLLRKAERGPGGHGLEKAGI